MARRAWAAALLLSGAAGMAVGWALLETLDVAVCSAVDDLSGL